MPYIKPEIRPRFDECVDEIALNISNVGELNYVITRLALKYVQDKGLSYSTLSTVVGTLRLVCTEIEQRLVRDYEDGKINENGDVREYLELL